MVTSGTSNELSRSYVWYLGHQLMKWLTTHSASVWIRNLGTNMTSLLSYLYLYFRNLYEVSHRTTKASKLCRTIYTLDTVYWFIHCLYSFYCLRVGLSLTACLLEKIWSHFCWKQQRAEMIPKAFFFAVLCWILGCDLQCTEAFQIPNRISSRCRWVN